MAMQQRPYNQND